MLDSVVPRYRSLHAMATGTMPNSTSTPAVGVGMMCRAEQLGGRLGQAQEHAHLPAAQARTVGACRIQGIQEHSGAQEVGQGQRRRKGQQVGRRLAAGGGQRQGIGQELGEPQHKPYERGGHRQKGKHIDQGGQQWPARRAQRVQRVAARRGARLQQQLAAAAAQHRGLPQQEHGQRQRAAQHDGLPARGRARGRAVQPRRSVKQGAAGPTTPSPLGPSAALAPTHLILLTSPSRLAQMLGTTLW